MLQHSFYMNYLLMCHLCKSDRLCFDNQFFNFLVRIKNASEVTDIITISIYM
jgi:hypothetical protein